LNLKPIATPENAAQGISSTGKLKRGWAWLVLIDVI
jgi:hypothetical protein